MPGSDESHDWFHTRNSQMDGKSKTSHIAPTTLGQMVPVESATVDDLTVNNQASIPSLNDLTTLTVNQILGLTEIGNDLRLVGDGDSVQDALDDVGSQGWVIIRPDYDESVETFPITISNKVRLSGTGFQDIVAPDNSVDTIQLDFGTSNDPPGPIIDNLGIENGQSGIKLITAQHGTLHNVNVTGATAGIDFQDVSGPRPRGWSIVSIDCSNNTGPGLQIGSNAFEAKLVGGITLDNGGAGIDVVDSAGVTIHNWESRGNGGHNMDIGAVNTIGISGCMIEGGDTNNNRDILLDGPDAATIEQTFFNGNNDNTTAVEITSLTARAAVKNCKFQNYTGAAITINGGLDHDIHARSHTTSSVGSLVNDNGTRTRSNGIVRTQDLSTLTGEVDGDIARDDGTNTTSTRPELAIWDDGNGVWFTQQGDTI